MIDVATLSVIRRWALREQLSIREIARRTGLSRNTIRKYLRAGEAEPHYAKRVSPAKLDPFALKLAGWLKTEAGRSRKQRRTVKQMHADLQALGYPGSYNRVAAFARLWHEQRLVAQQACSLSSPSLRTCRSSPLSKAILAWKMPPPGERTGGTAYRPPMCFANEPRVEADRGPASTSAWIWQPSSRNAAGSTAASK